MSESPPDLKTSESGRVSSTRLTWRDWLMQTTSFRFGMFTTYVLLAFTVVIALSPIEFSPGPRSEVPATVFSWLPSSLIRSGVFFFIARIVLIASAICWAMRKWLPISSWATVAAAFLYWSLRMENLTNGAHIFHATSMLLFIHAVWFHFYYRSINAGFDQPSGDASSRCYPRWVFWLCVFYLGWFHSLAGFSKIASSGLAWGNGASLQLWVDLFGWKGSPFAQLILLDTRLTAVLQSGALLIECASILAIVNRWFRYAIGLGLFGFYLGVLTTFIDFGFHFNATLVALFLLPTDRLFGLFDDVSTEVRSKVKLPDGSPASNDAD
ncbi:MAG: hypothetical protein AAFN77_09020 [Planctomycetota bacterium]